MSLKESEPEIKDKRYCVEYWMTNPKIACGISLFEGNKLLRVVMTANERIAENNWELELACAALNKEIGYE